MDFFFFFFFCTCKSTCRLNFSICIKLRFNSPWESAYSSLRRETRHRHCECPKVQPASYRRGVVCFWAVSVFARAVSARATASAALWCGRRLLAGNTRWALVRGPWLCALCAAPGQPVSCSRRAVACSASATTVPTCQVLDRCCRANGDGYFARINNKNHE